MASSSIARMLIRNFRYLDGHKCFSRLASHTLTSFRRRTNDREVELQTPVPEEDQLQPSDISFRLLQKEHILGFIKNTMLGYDELRQFYLSRLNYVRIYLPAPFPTLPHTFPFPMQASRTVDTLMQVGKNRGYPRC